MKDGAGGTGTVVEEGPQPLGNGEDELAQGHVGEDMIHEVGCRLYHALGITRRAGTPALAAERDQKVVAAS